MLYTQQIIFDVMAFYFEPYFVISSLQALLPFDLQQPSRMFFENRRLQVPILCVFYLRTSSTHFYLGGRRKPCCFMGSQLTKLILRWRFWLHQRGLIKARSLHNFLSFFIVQNFSLVLFLRPFTWSFCQPTLLPFLQPTQFWLFPSW